jgi:WD40 repeat protein
MVRILIGHTSEVEGVAFSPDGTMLATASADGTARLWEVPGCTPVSTLTGHTSSVNAVAFSPDGAMLATASADGTAQLWGDQQPERADAGKIG